MNRKFMMNTIDATYERAKEEKLGVPKRLIRQAVVQGVIPSVKSGKKYLINWNVFMHFLETGGQIEVHKEQEETVNGIRPIPTDLKPIFRQARERKVGKQ